MAVDYSRDDLEISFAEINRAPEARLKELRRVKSIQTGGKECNRADQND